MKLTPAQIKAVNAWVKKYAKKYNDPDCGYDTDQMCDDCCYDLGLQQFDKAIYTIIDTYTLTA